MMASFDRQITRAITQSPNPTIHRHSPDHQITKSPDCDEPEPLVPVRQEALDGIRGWLDRREPLPRFALRQVEHVAIPHQIDHPKCRHTCLPTAEEVAR